MLPRAIALIACWLALDLMLATQQCAAAQEPAANKKDKASQPTPEQAAKLKERYELSKRADKLKDEGKLPEAIEVAKQVLAIERNVFGELHAEVAETYDFIADMQEAAEDFSSAENSRQSANDLLTKLHGARHWQVIDARLALKHTGLLARLDTIGRQELQRVKTLDQRISVLDSAGKLREALSLAQEAMEIKRKVLGEEHRDYATSLNDLASMYHSLRDYPQAESFYRQALEINKKVLGEEHPDYATSMNNLAGLYRSIGDSDRAEPLFREALQIQSKVLGMEHPDCALGLNNLGLLYRSMGDYARAKPLLQRGLEIRKKVLGREHPSYATSLNSLAALYHSMGNYAHAEPLYRQALEIRKESLGQEHPSYASSLNNLAALYKDNEEYARAEPLLRQALLILKKMPGDEHPNYAISLNNLGGLYESLGDYQRAETLYRQAQEILRKVLGHEHPDYAGSLNNLGRLYVSTGDYDRAEPLYRQSLEIWKKTFGEEHPNHVGTLKNLAWLYYLSGDHKSSLARLRDAAGAYESARLRVAAQSLDRVAFGIDRSPYRLLAATTAKDGAAIEAWRALEADLARGLLDETSNRTGLHLTPPEAKERENVIAVLDVLQPRILWLVTQTETADESKAELARLCEQRKAAEGRLAKLAAEVTHRQVADLKEIQYSLPAMGAFVAWIDVSAYGRIQEHWGCVVRADREPAWVQLPGTGNDKVWTQDDTAFSKRLRDAVAQATALEKVTELSRQLAAQRIEPLLPHLEGVDHLFVAGVNAMAGVPVEALSDRFTVSYTPSGTQLARLRARQQPSGQATLLAVGDPIFNRPSDVNENSKPLSTRLPSGGLLINQVMPEGSAAKARIAAGDVLLAYASTELTSVQQLGELVAQHAMDESVTVTIWRESQDQPTERKLQPGKLGVVLARDLAPQAIARRRENDLLLASVTRGKSWDELPGTRVEIAGIAKLFHNDQITLLADSNASEQRLAALQESGELARFRYLHLATHGDVNRASAFESALILTQDQLSTADDVTAGNAYYDGRLTANEILQHWKLNAELVTLSSCESGLGRDGGGEGFLGFAQALLLAGARSVCLSLWEVDDTATALLMNRFYQNLLGKRNGLKAPLPKAEALAEAKRWLRDLTVAQATDLAANLSHGVARGAGHRTTVVNLAPPKASEPTAHPYEHPYYWAAFILIGDAE